MDAIDAEPTVEPTAESTHANHSQLPTEQPEPSVYLPGTPTASFLEYIEVAIKTLTR
ncbi:hypothetical protein [Natronorubrum daqingense]|uniref:Uncharacterized protein n=1 Tax=Natronorubrum daqingense TaxID=588898 RepID=A0A1N7BRQ0_9EURY|nr:hypothetical protein [Natronorubrum daqingense]SIR53972.1 hypothetical protein SAMN05421809_1323 [Natronorubrum daqingense]